MVARNSAAPCIFSNAAKPRSRKSCRTPKPERRAGCRIITSAIPISGFVTKTSSAAPISPMSSICRARAGRSPMLAIGAAVIGDREHAVPARQVLEQRPVELLRQRVQLHRLRDRRDDPLGQHQHHRRHDAREIRIALREVGIAVEIGLKEDDGVRVPRLGREIRVRKCQPLCLPRGKALERAGKRRVRGPAGVQPGNTLELAHERSVCGVGKTGGIGCAGHDGNGSRLRAPDCDAHRKSIRPLPKPARPLVCFL